MSSAQITRKRNPRRRGSSAQKTRESILDATIELLKEKPFYDISVDEICQVANSSVGSFYYNFVSKNDLYTYIYARFNEQLEEKWNSLEIVDPVEAIKFLVTEQLMGSAQYGTGFASHIFALQLSNLDTTNQVFTQEKRETYFLPHMLYEELKVLCKYKNNDADPNVITFDIIRSSRGVIFDWAIQNGEYDIYEKGLHHLNMILSYYNLI